MNFEKLDDFSSFIRLLLRVLMRHVLDIDHCIIVKHLDPPWPNLILLQSKVHYFIKSLVNQGKELTF